MKLRFILLVLSFLIPYTLFSQKWMWSKQHSSTTDTKIFSLGIDKNSNVYATGNLNTNIDIGAPDPLIPAGTKDNIYIVKYNENGSYLWHKQLAGTGNITRGKLKVDNNDSIIACAFYIGTCDSLPGLASSYKTNVANVFLAKYSSDGKLSWSKRIAWGPAEVQSQNITVDPNNNIYIIGSSTDTIYFENNNYITSSGGRIINYVAKFTPQGKFIHVTKFTSRSTLFARNKLMEISTINENEVYVGGFFTDSLSYASIKLYSSSFNYAVLAKINENGIVEWMRMVNSTAGYNRCNGISTDPYSNIYITGYISGSAIFDSTGNGTQNSSPLVSNGSYDMMIAKYNKNGTLQWKRRNGSTGDDIGYGIYISRNILMYSGYYSGAVTFNNVTLNSGSTSNTNTGFFVYDVDGNPVTAHDILGNGADRGENITYNNKGNTYIGGYFLSTDLTIGSNVYDCGGTQDGFIAVYQNPFSVTFSKQQSLTCNSDNNGYLIATPYFGAAPYRYTWSSNVTNFNDSLAYNLPAGIYSVTVTDARDSVATSTIILNQPPALNLNAVVSNVNCFPTDGISNNGAVNLSVTGGTVSGAYTYNWEAIAGSGVNATAEDQISLTAGTYAVYVKDNNLCEASDTFTINQPAQITFGLSTVTEETIPPGGNGAVNLLVSGGNPLFTYAWTLSGSPISINEDLINLTGGTYTILATDSKLCTSDTNFIVINDTMLIAYISSKTDVTCKGTNTGSATVSVLNGTGPYTYLWKNNLGNIIDGDNPSITLLPADIYFVTVTDNNSGKTATASAQILEPALALSTNLVIGYELKCYGDINGVADLTVNDGTLPYTFLWSNSRTTEDLIGIGAGNYQVTVTDSKGCTAIDEVDLTARLPMDIDIVRDQPVLCNGDLSAVLTATATGGTGSKNYIWNDPGNQTEQTATNLGAGIYTVTATDQNGCTITDSYTLLEPAILTLTETHIDASCSGDNDGIINLTPTGGTPTYNYDWSNGQIVQDISGLAPDTYTVIVTDANSCSNSLTVTIIQAPPVLIQSVAVSDLSCFGINDGELIITATGGSGTYTYSNNGGTSFSSNSTISNIPADDYSIVARDNTGCISSDTLVKVSQPAEILFQNISLTPATCNGSANGSIGITASGGAGAPFQYSIDNAANFSTNPAFTDLAAQPYQIVIADADGCQSADSLVSITEPDSIAIISEEAINISCNGSENGSIHIVLSGTASDYEYSIDNGSNYYDNSGIFTDLVTGSYQVRVRDLNNCEQAGSLLTIVEPALLLIDTSSVTHALGEENGAIEATADGGTSPYIFILDQSETDSLSTTDGEFTNLPPGEYILYAIDNNLCLSDSLPISILQNSTVITIYDAFSPNDDGVNDVWNIINIALYPDCKVLIFNSWGNKVFSSDGYTEPWDGKYNDKLLPAGTYYYIIDLGDGSGEKAGPVSIVR